MSEFRLVLKVKKISKYYQYRFRNFGLERTFTFSLVSYRNRAYRLSHLTPISALPCPVVPGQWTPVTRSDRAVVLCNTWNLKLFVKREWLRRGVCLYSFYHWTRHPFVHKRTTGKEMWCILNACGNIWKSSFHLKRSAKQTYSPNNFYCFTAQKICLSLWGFFLFRLVKLIKQQPFLKCKQLV